MSERIEAQGDVGVGSIPAPSSGRRRPVDHPFGEPIGATRPAERSREPVFSPHPDFGARQPPRASEIVRQLNLHILGFEMLERKRANFERLRRDIDRRLTRIDASPETIIECEDVRDIAAGFVTLLQVAAIEEMKHQSPLCPHNRELTVAWQDFAEKLTDLEDERSQLDDLTTATGTRTGEQMHELLTAFRVVVKDLEERASVLRKEWFTEIRNLIEDLKRMFPWHPKED